MSTFEQNIQQWVSIDNQLKLLNEKIHQLREKRNSLNENIVSYAFNHNLSNSAVQISDGKIKFTNSKIAPPLTFKYLEKCLGEIIHSESQVKQIMEYLKNKREFKTVPEIKRFYNK